MLTHLNLSHGYEVGPIIFILQMCKWKHREVKLFAQGHTASESKEEKNLSHGIVRDPGCHLNPALCFIN